MGMWDFEAWDNDSAADWFGDLMDTTGLRDTWVQTMQEAVAEDELHEFERPRAALWLFAQLGRTYIWPIDHIEGDLDLCLNVADKILALDYLPEEAPEFLELVKRDRDAIAKRKRPPT